MTYIEVDSEELAELRTVRARVLALAADMGERHWTDVSAWMEVAEELIIALGLRHSAECDTQHNPIKIGPTAYGWLPCTCGPKIDPLDYRFDGPPWQDLGYIAEGDEPA